MISSEDLNCAKKLKVLRKAMQCKQLYAAEKIGLSSQQEYSKLESGKMPFTDELLQRICDAFQVPVDHFRMNVNHQYKTDWREFIKEGKVTDLVELVSNRGLVLMLLSSEIKAMELELKLIERELNERKPPSIDNLIENNESDT